MEFEHRLKTIQEVRRYAFAGKAIITLHVPGVRHFTYKIIKSKKNPLVFWVYVLTGPDNTTAYQQIGMIRSFLDVPVPYTKFTTSPMSTIENSALSFRWFHKFIYRLGQNYLPDALEVWREHRCGKCRRRLTDPKSIELGIGPICRGESSKFN